MPVTYPASPRQHDFIRSLVTERQVPIRRAHEILKLVDDGVLTGGRGGSASGIIGELLALPKEVAPPARPAAAGNPWGEVNDAVALLPLSKFIVPDEFMTEGLKTHFGLRGNDSLFLEAKEYRGRRYFRQLIGSPGDFARRPMRNPGRTLELLEILNRIGPLNAGRLFSIKFTCCARCGASLTDQVSRDTGYGPDCRVTVGLPR